MKGWIGRTQTLLSPQELCGATAGPENGDAESGGDAPAAWKAWTTDPSGYRLTWAEGENPGSHSLAIRITGSPSQTDYAFWGQSVREGLPSGKTVELRVRVRVSGVEGIGVALVIRGDTDDPLYDPPEMFATTQGVKRITGTKDWTTYTVRSPGVRSDIRALTVFLGFSGPSGTAWFDDVCLETIQ